MSLLSVPEGMLPLCFTLHVCGSWCFASTPEAQRLGQEHPTVVTIKQTDLTPVRAIHAASFGMGIEPSANACQLASCRATGHITALPCAKHRPPLRYPQCWLTQLACCPLCGA